jgi:hypothetical protein
MTVVLLFCVAITSSRHFPLIALSVGRVVTRLPRRLDFTQAQFARNVRVGVVRVHESGHHLVFNLVHHRKHDCLYQVHGSSTRALIHLHSKTSTQHREMPYEAWTEIHALRMIASGYRLKGRAESESFRPDIGCGWFIITFQLLIAIGICLLSPVYLALRSISLTVSPSVVKLLHIEPRTTRHRYIDCSISHHHNPLTRY